MNKCIDCKWYRKPLKQGRCHYYPQVVEKNDNDFCSHFEILVMDKPSVEPKTSGKRVVSKPKKASNKLSNK